MLLLQKSIVKYSQVYGIERVTVFNQIYYSKYDLIDGYNILQKHYYANT